MEKVASQCPNLHALHVLTPEIGYVSSPWISLPRTFGSGVLGNIRHLQFTGTARSTDEISVLTRFLEAFPGLESLSISHLLLRLSGPQEACLGTSLSNLQHLQRLQCESVQLNDGTWTMQAWLKRIEVLELKNCYPLQKHEIIQLLDTPLSSQLRELHLSFGKGHTASDDQGLEDDLDLPSLTRLSLKDTKSCELLSNFQKCQRITRISLFASPTQLVPIKRFICAGTWVKLGCLEIHYSLGITDGMNEEELLAIEQIQSYCEHAGVKLFGL